MALTLYNPKVFISYAREDVETAQKVAEELTIRGISVWLDSRELLPGENWEVRISKAIQSSDFLVSIISEHSSRKIGYVQSELRQALNRQHQHPTEAVYLIPMLIGNIEIPYAIKDLHATRLTANVSESVAQIALSIRKSWAPEHQRREFSASLKRCKWWLSNHPVQLSLLCEYYPNTSRNFSLSDAYQYAKYCKLIEWELLASEGDEEREWAEAYSEFDYTVSITPLGIQVIDSLRSDG